MNTAKKTWVSPKATLEEFTPNEYVSACWGVGCTVRGDDIFPDKDTTHGADGCGNSSHQYIYDSNGDNVIDGMYEMSPDQGRLECTLYSDSTYTTKINPRSVQVGTEIYWTTSAKDGRTWHHKGTANATYPAHPNRS